MAAPANQVETMLARARSARQVGDGPACIEALRAASAVAVERGEPDGMALTSWRHAKAIYDFGAPESLMDALGPALSVEAPFRAYPRGLDAVERVTRHVWDHVGYSDHRVDRLWSAYVAHYRVEGDPYLAAMGEVHAAWAWACRGEVTALSEWLERWSATSPRTLGSGPHRHADAPDTGSSVYWIQMDVARVVLRGATWAGEERLAWTAWQAYEDAVEDAGVQRDEQYWFLEPVCRGALKFGWKRALPYLPAWQRAAAVLAHPRAPLHREVLRAELARARGDLPGAEARFMEAVRLAAGTGPEWLADALTEAERCGADTTDTLQSLIASASVTAFARSSSQDTGEEV